MRARIEIDEKPDKLAMAALSECLTRLAAEVIGAGVVTPLTLRSAATFAPHQRHLAPDVHEAVETW